MTDLVSSLADLWDLLIWGFIVFAIVAGVVSNVVRGLGMPKSLNPRCPGCDKQQLGSGQFIQSETVALGGKYGGRRATHGWTYYRCAACEKRWKHSSRTNAWDELSTEQWDDQVARRRPPSE